MRENTYYVLDELVNKGLVTFKVPEKKRRKVYSAQDPSLLLALHDQRRGVIEAALPDIKTLYEHRQNKPKFEFFEGLEEIQKIYLRTVHSEAVYALGSTRELSERMPEFYKEYFRQLRLNNVILKDILSAPSKHAGIEAKRILTSLYDVWALPEEYGDFPTDILVWDEHVAIIALSEPYFGTMITHPQIAKSFKMVLELLHSTLDRVE